MPRTGNGTLADPYCSIQMAINGVRGGVILVAPGTYGRINYNKSNNVVRSTHGPLVTIIDGDGLPAVKCVNGETSITLDGFTITGGQANNPGGGGMIAWDCGGAIVMNCIFTGNTATAATAGKGGGLYCLYSGVTVVDCIFTGNLANSGAGVSVEESFVEVIGCTFDGNIAINGAGITHEMDCCFSSVYVTDCTFIDNMAIEDGGGIANFNNFTTVVTNCTFQQNEARYGGGIVNGGIVNVDGAATITGCLFTGNTAELLGGGLAILGFTAPTITNCTLAMNTARGLGGGMWVQTGNTAAVRNTVNWLNTPPSFGGSTAVITYSSFENGPVDFTNRNEYPFFADPFNGDGCTTPSAHDHVPLDGWRSWRAVIYAAHDTCADRPVQCRTNEYRPRMPPRRPVWPTGYPCP